MTKHRGAVVIGIVGLLAFAATLYLFFPGYMSRDSGNQLEQARGGVLTDHHPILMAVIWRLLDKIVPGPFGMLVLTSALYWAGLAGIFWALPGRLAARAAGLLATGFILPPFCCLAGIWKDSLMHAAMLAGIACAVVPVGARWLRYLLASGLLLLAIGLRHNAAAAVWPLLVLLVIERPFLRDRPPRSRLLLAGLVSLLLTLGATVGLKRALAPFARAENFWQRAAAFDLAAISLRTGTMVIDAETGLLGPGVSLDELRAQYRPDFNDSLYHCGYNTPDRCKAVVNLIRDERQLSRLSRNWIRAIVAHPGAFLAHRADMTARLLRLGGLEPRRRYYYLANAPFHRLAGDYHPPPRTLKVLDWLDLQQTWIGFSAWIYVLASCVLLPVTLARHLRGGPLLPLVCVVSGLSYLLSVLLTAGGPDNRYTVWTVLCTLLGLLATVIPLWRAPAPRSPGTAPEKAPPAPPAPG